MPVDGRCGGGKNTQLYMCVYKLGATKKKGNFFCGQTALNWLNDVLHNDGARQNLK